MYYVVYSVTKYYPPKYAYCCVFEYTFNSYYVTLKEKIQSLGTTKEYSIFLDKFYLLTSYPESDMVDCYFAFLEQWKYKGSVY